MQINKLYDDVYEIKDFLSKEEFDAVNYIINNTPEEDWFDEESKKKIISQTSGTVNIYILKQKIFLRP